MGWDEREDVCYEAEHRCDVRIGSSVLLERKTRCMYAGLVDKCSSCAARSSGSEVAERHRTCLVSFNPFESTPPRSSLRRAENAAGLVACREPDGRSVHSVALYISSFNSG